MYYKKFERYIALCLLKQITLTLYVSGKPTGGENSKIFTDFQLNDLALDVCTQLEFFVNVTVNRCMENYWAPEQSMPQLSPHVRIRCWRNKSIWFQIKPSENFQLVALVPHPNNDDYFIQHSIIEPWGEFEEMPITPQVNYTIWSTELKDGSPVKWRRGDTLPPHDRLMAQENKTYEIKKFFHPTVDPSVLDGRFTWNTSGDADVCFDVLNFCGKSNLKQKKIWPNNENIEPYVVFDRLPVEDECIMEVVGMYGTTKVTYRTPFCYPGDCPPSPMEPEMATNITIFAIEDSFDSWEVHVSWARPDVLHDLYNVSLWMDEVETQRIILPGDVTEAVFRNVTSNNSFGLYQVAIRSKLGNKTATTIRQAQFPDTAGAARGAEQAGGAGVAAVGAGCAAAAALALLCRCRRRRDHLPVPSYKPDDKPLKEGDTDVLEVWSETEDRWEVRADKLVLHEVIGEGAFGVVRRATLAPHSMLVAVKMLKDFPSLEEIRSFRSEMELMKSVGVHPHLVSLVGCCSGRRPLIIAEYCSRGDLLSYLRCTWDVMLSKRNAKYYNNNIDVSDYRNDLFKCKAQMESSKLVVNKLYELQEICDKELTALDLLSFCRQIAMGMEFLAANRVVHRDLAARNILVTADRTLKIADFGLSRDVYEENQYKQKGNGKMPIRWMALESLTRRIYTTQSDVWSFGVVVWEVATVGGSPYAAVPAARLPRLLRAGYRMPRPNNCSPQLYDIMLSCWRTHPRDRPTFADLHQRLDELLNSACANQYLSLEIDADDAPPTPKHHRYIKMLMRGKRAWSRGETYERPLKAPQSNHYTSPPDSLSAQPAS
ncbi:tyrosine-protein kinase receptor torso isoform X2 [Spodoptera frugiperda]|uniref:receptor protein-tyrosine kinase n=1 Tax=Spodoptera frugiperda TaxID=7108 RepID=A0A9R0DP79_SPOFR|nr:tyrosine-protein kinase receptor torso isoform X2 [Spodoptera frugiperda]